jgi:hypothetical protein
MDPPRYTYTGDPALEPTPEERVVPCPWLWMGELRARRERHLRCDFDFDPCRDCGDWQCGRSEIVAPA